MATTEIDLTYAGRRLNQRGKLAYFYEPKNAPGTLQGYPKPLVSGTKIGAVVRLTEEDDGRYYVAGEHAPRIIGNAPESSELLAWSVAQEADVALHAQRAREKRVVAAGVDPIRAALQPIRDELAGMSAAHRAAAIGWIISYLSAAAGSRR